MLSHIKGRQQVGPQFLPETLFKRCEMRSRLRNRAKLDIEERASAEAK